MSRPAVHAALHRAERACRPGLPLGGYRVTRRPGDRLPVLLTEDGRLCHDPGARIQAAAVSPDRARVALELCDDGTENGHLVVVDTRTGTASAVPGLVVRHSRPVWPGGRPTVIDADSTVIPEAGRVVVTAADRPVVTDVEGRVVLAGSPPRVLLRPDAGERAVALVLGGRLLVALTGDERTRLVDPAGTELLRLPRARALTVADGSLLAVTAAELFLLTTRDDGPVVTGRIPLCALDGTPVHAQALPTGALVHLLRGGHSVLLRLDVGTGGLVPVEATPLSRTGEVRTVTGLAWADGRPWARVEGPATPPRVLPLEGRGTRMEDLAALAPAPAPALAPAPASAPAPALAPPPPPASAAGPRADPARSAAAPGAGMGTRPAGRPASRVLRVAADDGAEIELILTGSAGGPVLVEVYGGFGVTDLPRYEPSVAAWCELGGLHVTARLRGGGGTGTDWHRQGRGAGKTRTVADAVAVARTLAERGLTRPGRLVLAGASLGGLVAVSAALTRPGLVAGVACTAAPLDPHHITEHPAAPHWAEEFGDPDDPAVRAAMDDYSPFERARRHPGTGWPRFLLTTFADDTRVAPGPTDRLAGLLAARGARVARRHRPRLGHGGNPLDAVHDFAASVLDFALDCTGSP